MAQLHTICAGSSRAVVDLAVGHLHTLELAWEGQVTAPLYRAAWVDEPQGTAFDGSPPVERHLSGDFLCAPFGASDIDPAPPHGWSANSAWDLMTEADGAASFRLQRPIMGATVVKELHLAEDAPLLYQTHHFIGGSGALPVAHHVMTHMSNRGRLSFSPKKMALTPEIPLEPDRHQLAYPAETADLDKFPTTAGGTTNLHDYPAETGFEEFVTLVEASQNSIGWTAVLRTVEQDILFILKDPKILPVTMLWFSNGGRDYAPWNGIHTGVLGIEDGCAAGSLGHAGSLTQNAVSKQGVKTALDLGTDGGAVIRHVIGAVPAPRGWTEVADIRSTPEQLVLSEPGGDTLALPFDSDFFIGEGP